MNGFLGKVVPTLAGAVSGEKPAPAWCAGSRRAAVGGSGVDQVSGVLPSAVPGLPGLHRPSACCMDQVGGLDFTGADTCTVLQFCISH